MTLNSVILLAVSALLLDTLCQAKVINFDQECLKEFRKVSLQAHNEYRRMHNVSSLTQEELVEASAQKYADQLASSNKFAYSKNRANTGENLFVKYSYDRLSLEMCQGNYLQSSMH